MTQPGLVYTDLDRLNDWMFHVKQYKLGHHQQVVSRAGGSSRSPRKGRGMDFAEVRHYQAGDEVRHIDWRVTARTQKPHTKLFTEEHERQVIFLIEQSSRLFFGSKNKFKSVLALDIASILGWAAFNGGDKVGGQIVGDRQWIEPKHQQKNLQLLFNQALQHHRQLNQPGLGNHQAWSSTLQTLASRILPNSKVILIGDLFALHSSIGLLQSLSKHSNLLAIHLTDPLEYQLPANGKLMLTYAEQNLKIDSDSQKQRQNYSDSFNQAWSQLQHAFSQVRAACVKLQTTDDLIPQMMNLGLLRR